MKISRACATLLMIGVVSFHGLPARATPTTLDARFHAQIQEAYQMLYRGAETGDSEMMARGQEKLQAIVSELQGAMRAHPRDPKLKDLLRSVLQSSGSAGTIDDHTLDALEKQLALP